MEYTEFPKILTRNIPLPRPHREPERGSEHTAWVALSLRHRALRHAEQLRERALGESEGAAKRRDVGPGERGRLFRGRDRHGGGLVRR